MRAGEGLQRHMARKTALLQWYNRYADATVNPRPANRGVNHQNRPLRLCYSVFYFVNFVYKRYFFTLSSTKIFYFPLDFISLRPGNLPAIVVARSDTARIGSKTERRYE